METLDYTLAWAVYLLAALGFTLISWRVAKRLFWRELAYFLQGFLMVLLFTPWYVLADEEVLAPAIIIFMMDSITIGSTAGIRALIPMVMGVLLVIVVTIVLSIIYRLRRAKSK